MTETSTLETILCSAALLVALVGGLLDQRTGRIPDMLTLPALGLALASSYGLGGPRALLASCMGALLGALVPLFLHAIGGIGGGDVKLLAALGALLGPMRVLELELVAFILATAFGLGAVFVDGKLRAALRELVAWLRGGRRGPRPALFTYEVRFGLPILVATLAALIPANLRP